MGNQCSCLQPEEAARKSVKKQPCKQARDSGALHGGHLHVNVTGTGRVHQSAVLHGTATTPPGSSTTSSAQRTTAAPGLSPRGLFRSSGSEAGTPCARPTSRTVTAAAATAEAKPQQVSYKALMKETMDRIRANQAARRAAERAAPLGPVQLLGSVPNEASNSNLNQSTTNHAGGPALHVDNLPPERQDSWGGGSNNPSGRSAERKKKKEARPTEDQQYGGSNHRLSTNPFVPSDMAVRFSGSLSLRSTEEDSSSLSSGTDPLGRSSPRMVRREKTPGTTVRGSGARWSANGSRSGSGYAGGGGSVGSGRLEERPLGGDAFDTASWSSASPTRATPNMSRASSICHE